MTFTSVTGSTYVGFPVKINIMCMQTSSNLFFNMLMEVDDTTLSGKLFQIVKINATAISGGFINFFS